MFGTDDVIYVPEGQKLSFDEIYRWKRYKIDVRRLGLRVRAEAFEEVSNRVRSALRVVQGSPRFADIAAQVGSNASAMLADLARLGGSAEDAIPGDLHETVHADAVSWWVRITDLPAESYYLEDYEREIGPVGKGVPYRTFGTVHVAQLEGLEISMPPGDEGGPVTIDVPAEDGLERFTIPPLEPLPLVREFCGMHGASAHGRTVNIATNGELAPAHHFCTPMGRIGNHLLATLYFHCEFQPEGTVVGAIAEKNIERYLGILEKSKFELASSGPTWRIFARGGDVVHVYAGLEGKETEGFETMPAVLLVASAAGQFDPMQRAELYEAIKEAAKPTLLVEEP